MMKCIVIFSILLSSQYVSAQQGFLDTSFGNNGLVDLNVNGFCRAVALQNDGKILAGGSGEFGYTLARYLPDGMPDKSFSEDGIAEIEYKDTAPPYYGEIKGISATNENKILIVANAKQQILLARFLLDGTLDSAFGKNGLLYLDNIDDTFQYPAAMQLQTDGKIVIAGSVAYDQPYYSHSPLIIRLLPDGSYDKSFGNNGRVFFYGDDEQRFYCVALQHDGKILAGGYRGLSDTHFLTARCNSDGSADTSFGENGIVITEIDNEFNTEEVYSILVQGDGKILSGGSASNGFKNQNKKMTVVRYLTNGELDKSFGDRGFARVQFDNKPSYLYTAALQNDGKIIAAGFVRVNTQSSIGNFAVCRLNSNGIVDSSFGINGRQTTEFSNDQAVYSSVIERDGDIDLGGYFYDGIKNSGFLIARYNGNPAHPLIARIKRWIINHTLYFSNSCEDTNTAYYAVEKSDNLLSGFIPVAKIDAGQKEYSFALPVSSFPCNTIRQVHSFYRIKIVNKDNSFSYTQPVSSTNDNKNTINISPNPVNGAVNISGLNSDLHYEISIIDKNGSVVLGNIKFQPSAGGYSINVSSLKTDLYFIRIKDRSGLVADLKFVKE